MGLGRLRSSENPEIREIIKEIGRLEERVSGLERDLGELITEDGKKVFSKSR